MDAQQKGWAWLTQIVRENAFLTVKCRLNALTGWQVRLRFRRCSGQADAVTGGRHSGQVHSPVTLSRCMTQGIATYLLSRKANGHADVCRD